MAFQLGLDIRDDDTYIVTNQCNDTVWNRNDANPLTKVIQLDYTHPIEDKHGEIEIGENILTEI